MLSKLKNNRGEFLIESVFKILLGAAALALIISIFGTISQANRLAAMANDLTRALEIRGVIDNSFVASELNNLSAAAGLSGVTYHVDRTGRVQFGDPFTITLNYTGHFGIGGVLTVPVPFHSTVVGRSEKYWK